jgi:hypothetical protein
MRNDRISVKNDICRPPKFGYLLNNFTQLPYKNVSNRCISYASMLGAYACMVFNGEYALLSEYDTA